MKKWIVLSCLFLIFLSGCGVRKPISNEEILQLIKEANTAEKMKAAEKSIYIKDNRAEKTYSVYDDGVSSVTSYYDEKDLLYRTEIREKDFLYSLEDGKFSQLIDLKDEADIWEKMASYFALMDLKEVERTDVFYIVKARIIDDRINDYFKKDKRIASADMDLMVDKTFLITSIQNEVLNYEDGSKEELSETEIVYGKKPENAMEQEIRSFFDEKKEFRSCTVIREEDGAESSVQYNIAKGAASGVVLPAGSFLHDRSCVFDDEEMDNDVSYRVSDREEGKEVIHEGTLSEDGVYTDDASGFVSLNSYIPDLILEIRYATTYNFVGDRIDGYQKPLAFLSKEAAQALKKASDEFVSKGYRLKIYDAYRPQRAVEHFIRWAEDIKDVRMKPYFYPDLDKSVLFEQNYIADRSSHSRGSTLDLTLFDMSTGKDVDMGGTFDLFSEISHTDYEDLNDVQKANRRLLNETMKKYGFNEYAEEWWHYTLKNEPYPNTYFDFVIDDSVLKGNE